MKNVKSKRLILQQHLMAALFGMIAACACALIFLPCGAIATVALMATDALPPQVTDRSWLPGKGQVGFGIDFAVRHSPPADAEEASGAVGEFFWDGYANTLFWIDPRNDIAAVLFTQDVPPGSTGLHKAFRDAVYVHDAAASAAGKPPRAR